MLSLYGTPYYVLGFYKKPQISKEPLVLKGGTLRPGDEIACITGRKTSAGFDMLYPVAPVKFRYVGIHYSLSGNRYVLWLPSENGKAQNLSHPDYAEVYFGHSVFMEHLFFTIPAGSGRVIESDEVYFEHAEVPDEVRRIAGIRVDQKDGESQENRFPQPICAC